MTNSSRTATYSIRRHPFHAVLAALALFLAGISAPVAAEPGNDNRAPVLVGDCEKLAVSSDNKVTAYLFARGVQIYRWDGATWSFVNPEATLYANADLTGEVCLHFGGPTWQSLSGSRVVGAVDQKCVPDPDSIPWLLLHATVTEGPGIFDGVTFIQRINTVGGNAPSEPGDFVGEIARIPYTAHYVFYRHHD